MTTDRRGLLAVLATSVLLGTAFVALMPPGLPYDEPSHWMNVAFMVEHGRIPVLGDPGVTYEAQMGPLAYAVMALAAAPFWSVSSEVAFYVSRVVGVVELLALVVLVWRLTRKALPARTSAAVLAAAMLGLNPMMLAMAASVQNDVLSVLLAAAAVDVATTVGAQRARSAVAGLLVGLALLAKVTAWPVGAVLGAWFLWRRRWGAAALYGLTAALVAGWWFVRNLHLYGDLTGRRGVAGAGYDFPALGWDPVHLARDVVTYLWIPVEYVRNTVQAPLVVDAVVVLLTVGGLVGLALAVRAVGPTGRLLLAVTAVALVGWVVVATTTQAVAFRFAYVGLPGWFVGVGSVELPRWGRALAVGGALALLGLDAWFLAELAGMTDPGLLRVADR